MSDTLKTFLFTLLLSLGCSALLAVVSARCQPLYEENKKLERKIKTLSVLGIEVPAEASREEIRTLYEGKIVEKTGRDETGRGRVTAYEYREPQTGRLLGVAFPVRGKGLWGPIGGMLALEGDLATIRGIRFFDHQETPGLGAEIEKDWFQKQFEQRRAVDPDTGRVVIRVAKPGSTAGPEEVDGISGATITGDGVSELLGRELRAFRERYAAP